MPRSAKAIRWEIYSRPNAKQGKPVYYVRAVDIQTKKALLTRSTGSDSRKAARELIAELSAKMDFTRLAAAKTGNVDAASASQMENMPLSEYFVLFWNKEKSFYLLARADSGKPLSSAYVAAQYANVKTHAEPFEGFKTTALRDANLFLIETYIRHLRAKGVSGNVVGDCLNAIRTPLSWAMKRGLVLEPFSFSGIIRPKETYRTRGMITREELARIIALDVADTIQPRPRLKKGETHETPGPVDLRIKVGVLLAHLGAMRAGEIRALRWAAIDFEQNRIHIEQNFVEGDGLKAPKRESYGIVPLAEPLREPLQALRTLAFKLGRYNINEYVLFSLTTPNKPISIKGLEHGYSRLLEWIGIPPEAQKARRLTLHGGWHFAASLLADEIGPALARKITRHRSLQAFKGYDHESAEALDAARKALQFEPKNEKAAE
ncbi:hypothetical protein ER57_05340 [Smithella sp. SCADC]|jgi:integrase|uniref:Tyr recombinase domain-containing protein n=1 Tax=uncultured spirochete TaxID=156406 RepID=A0A3P3XGW6_9SPIR|nr:site-specific integrase [Rectinema subterraneum]KFO68265.1 hypothetical protein ER57_05340 [Smithella sp. SCADC]SLM11527.1 hypothetical protein SPIROBIBN47_200003 [uncultured spirochete]